MIRMNKIGKKIYTSYFVIIALMAIITGVLFNTVSDKYLERSIDQRLYKELKLVLETMGRPMNKGGNNNNIAKLFDKRKFFMVGRMIESDLIIVDGNNRVVYTDIKMDEKELTKEEVEEVYFKDYIYRSMSKHNMTIYLGSDKREVNYINRANLLIQLISVTVAMIIVFFIAIIFEKSLIRPIKMLTRKMKSFSIDEKYEKEIYTNDEIEELDETFVKMAEKIQLYAKQRKIAFQNTSHELKTPLMSIQGYAEAIKDGVIPEEEVNDSLDIISK